MTFEQLLYFSEVYRLKSITDAAQNLYVSRPSLSRSIRRLEEEFNIALFNRQSDGVEPTAAGHQLYQHAQTILQEQNQLNQNMLKFSNSAPVPICRIGLSKLLSSTYAQGLLDMLSSMFAETYFDFFVCQKSEDRHFYTDYDISIILLPENEIQSYQDTLTSQYEMRRISAFPISVWISGDSELCSLPVITKEDLQNHSFCTFKNMFHITNLAGILGHGNQYYEHSQTVELEKNFADKIEKFDYYTIDCPVDKGDYLYRNIFQNRQVRLKSTDEKLILEIIYRKDTCTDFYPSIAAFFTE